MNSTPLVSIIIPTFNRCELLAETLASVQNQTFQNWECIIVDDGSTDETNSIVKEWSEKDKRFRYFNRPELLPKGANSCRNFGFGSSSGKYVQWLDDDDLISNNKLELQLKNLEAYDDWKIFTICDWDLFWTKKKIERKNFLMNKNYVPSSQLYEELGKQQTFVPSHAYLVHRKLILQAGNWSANLSLNDDAEFFTRIVINSKKIINTRDCYVLYREHSGSRISRQKDASNLNSLLLSFRLMQAYLKTYSFESGNYFRWKLLKTFHQHWETNPEILKKHYYLFKENGIDLNFAKYYQAKYAIYRKVYPFYKRNIKQKT